LIFAFRNDTHQSASTDVLSRERNDIKPSLPRDETTLSRLTEVVEHFDQMNLREPLLRGIYGYDFERPSDVQQRALKPCISGSFSIISLKLKFVQ
jgi:superfamily II DNA/RNA helicase